MVLVPPAVGIFRMKVAAPSARVQLPNDWKLRAKLPEPVTGCPLTVPVQAAVPVSPWEVAARRRSCGVTAGGGAVVAVMGQFRSAAGAALAGGAGTGGTPGGRARGARDRAGRRGRGGMGPPAG